MNIYIIRNNQRFGPYQEHMLLSYVNQGVVLKQDKAIIDGESQEQTVEYYLKKLNIANKVCVANKGNFIEQLSAIGMELIFPKTSLFSRKFLYDTRLIILAVVGLLPMVYMLNKKYTTF